MVIGIAVVEWVGLTVSFWQKTGAVYQLEHVNETENSGAGTREALKSKVTWLCSLFFFAYMGVEVSAVAVAFLGFFLGPMFPGSVMVTAKLLPAKIHVSAIGFAMAIGGTGGTIFPFAIGAIANSKGVGVLQPIILALITVVAGPVYIIPVSISSHTTINLNLTNSQNDQTNCPPARRRHKMEP
ncbi:unnamed protein product [Fusarium graminearum]|nr:unnamed protein product [Fusarium graminearum]